MLREVALNGEYTDFHVHYGRGTVRLWRIPPSIIVPCPYKELPTTARDLLSLGHLGNVAPDHRFTEILAHFR